MGSEDAGFILKVFQVNVTFFTLLPNVHTNISVLLGFPLCPCLLLPVSPKSSLNVAFPLEKWTLPSSESREPDFLPLTVFHIPFGKMLLST